VAELLRRTEGWPVALYLAALSIKTRHVGHGGGIGFGGRDRLLVDYLRSVLLSRLSPAEVRFLTRTAALDRLSGPLCDAVLGTTGSAEVLASLERANLLVVPLDDQREWYRYHQLFRELLRGQLARHEPALVPQLTRRAAQWCGDHGLPEAAIDYAMDAGDADLVARGVEQVAVPVYRSGRLATVRRWFDWFDDRGLVEQYPTVAVVGPGCRRWAATRPLPSGGPMRPSAGPMRGSCPTAAPRSMAGGLCCGPSYAATGSSRCRPTPSWPWR
jgi:LuxR family transcriptional regulator, maltose regulon positive regulatory protein